MKKTLVALAALASMSAFAQSSVTLYGVADVWLGSAKTTITGGTGAAAVGNANNPFLLTPPTDPTTKTNGVAQTVLNSGGYNGSRWGLKGSEDLGGGLKANFQFESGFDISKGESQQGALFGRQAYAGLSGGFGEIRLGRQYTAYDELRGATANTFDSAFSPTGNVWGYNGDYSGRQNNQLYYATPDFGGISGAVGFALGENKTATTKATDVLSLHVKYANGPILVGAAYQDQKVATGGSDKYTLFAGSYDFGVVKLTGGYNTDKKAAAGTGTTKEFQLGVSLPIGAASIGAGFSAAKNSTTNSKASGFGVSAIYDLSKRTSVYGGIETDKAQSTLAGDGTTVKNTLAAVGVRHKF